MKIFRDSKLSTSLILTQLFWSLVEQRKRMFALQFGTQGIFIFMFYDCTHKSFRMYWFRRFLFWFNFFMWYTMNSEIFVGSAVISFPTRYPAGPSSWTWPQCSLWRISCNISLVLHVNWDSVFFFLGSPPLFIFFKWISMVALFLRSSVPLLTDHQSNSPPRPK